MRHPQIWRNHGEVVAIAPHSPQIGSVPMIRVSTLSAVAASAAVAGFATVGSVLFGAQAASMMLAAPVFGLVSLGTGIGAATLAMRGR